MFFRPKDFTEEHRMIGRTTEDFVISEVVPRLDQLEKLDLELTRELLAKCGDLGLLGVEVPEKYGGLELDKASATIVAEKMSRAGSFAVSHSADTGIGTLPIVYFGTEEQKKKYLPRMVEGKMRSAPTPCPKPSSGSDAVELPRPRPAFARRQALHPQRREDVDHQCRVRRPVSPSSPKWTAKSSAPFWSRGLSPASPSARKRHKMGIRGSSTRVLVLQDRKVPVENLLGEIGRGHVIAFNILNVGRFKLGAMCVGGARRSLGERGRLRQAAQGVWKAISSFGPFSDKLAEHLYRTWVGESAVYRTVGMMDVALEGIDMADATAGAARRSRSMRSSARSSRCWGSEMIDYVVDETVQIYGGYGFVEEYPAERAYRDARINRIFEGTNEINRLIITGFLLKRAMKGQLPLLDAAQKLQRELLNPLPLQEDSGALMEGERRAVAAAEKKISLLILGAAAQKYALDLVDQQEVLMCASNMIIDTYAMESALLRALKTSTMRSSEDAALIQERHPDFHKRRPRPD